MGSLRNQFRINGKRPAVRRTCESLVLNHGFRKRLVCEVEESWETVGAVRSYDSVTPSETSQSHSKTREILPWLALGPVTGLLAWRMYRCFRNGDRLLSALYALVILAFWVGMMTETGQALAALAQ
jgi:hypothetical protein